MFIQRAIKRTATRLQSLYDTVKDEYWKTHYEFEAHGCSLLPEDVSKRATRAATCASCFIIFVTLPVILYHRGFSEPSLFFGLALEFGMCWLLFYILVCSAHFMYALSFIAGSKIGRSDAFLSYVGKRWGKRIDEITNNFLVEKNIATLVKLSKSGEEDAADIVEEGNTDEFVLNSKNNNLNLDEETIIVSN